MKAFGPATIPAYPLYDYIVENTETILFCTEFMRQLLSFAQYVRWGARVEVDGYISALRVLDEREKRKSTPRSMRRCGKL
jgi:hypothetical protein